MAKNNSTKGLLKRLKNAHTKANNTEFEHVYSLLCDRVLNLQKIAERRGAVSIEKSKRFLEVLEAEGSTHRLTINPVTGRITLKLAKCTPIVVLEITAFVKEIMMQDFEPICVRGSIRWSESLNGYRTTLQSESKKYVCNFWTEDGKFQNGGCNYGF